VSRIHPQFNSYHAAFTKKKIKIKIHVLYCVGSGDNIIIIIIILPAVHKYITYYKKQCAETIQGHCYECLKIDSCKTILHLIWCRNRNDYYYTGSHNHNISCRMGHIQLHDNLQALVITIYKFMY